jgi:hypothetical protein
MSVKINCLPSRYEYSVFQPFITFSQIESIKSLLPPKEQWFHFRTGDVTRFQCRNLTPKIDSELFTIMNQLLASANLKLSKEIIHPRLFKASDYMRWHSDYDHLPFVEGKLEYECILVLHNTSDSVTSFKVDKNDDTVVEQYHSKDGDMLIVCRNGITHRVDSPTYGERLTLKFSCKQIE